MQSETSEEIKEVASLTELLNQQEQKDFIIHYKRRLFDSIDAFQLFSEIENPPKVCLNNKQLYKMVLTVDRNEKLVKKAKIWKGVAYAMLASFVGTGT